MKFLILFITIFLSLNISASSNKDCIDRIACYSYNDGRSMFFSASKDAHEKDREIPDYVYVRLVFFDTEGVRHSRSKITDNWYQKIDSDYFSAPTSSHIKSRKANYQKALRKCNEVVDNLKWEIGECSN